MFTLDPRLENDTVCIGALPLCLVLLNKDANYPWCILVPQREEVREIHALNKQDRAQLLEESCVLSEVMSQIFKPLKMNIAALGNMVPQLHVHHIARFAEDKAWPNPIWGYAPQTVYEQGVLEDRINVIRSHLSARDMDFSEG